MISQEEHDEQVRAARAWQAAHPPVVPVKTDAERIDALVKVTAKLIEERCFLLGELDTYIHVISEFLVTHPADDENTAKYAKHLLERVRNSARTRVAQSGP